MRSVRCLLLAIAAACSAIAAPIACPVGTLSDYYGLSEGCTLGGFTFTDFSPASLTAGSLELPAGSVGIQPLATLDGFQFTFNQSLTGLIPIESIFSFNLSGARIAAALLNLGGAAATGNANSLGLAQLCTGDMVTALGCPGASESLTTLVTSSFSQTSDYRSFAEVDTLGVIADFIVDPAGDSATLASATLQFTSVPEPSSWIFALTGLAATLTLRFRKQR